MTKSDIENPKLGFENPESRELFNNISFFEKNLKKKLKKNFLHFGLILGYFPYCKNKPKMRFFGFRLFWLRVLGGRTIVLRRSVWSQKTSQIAGMTIVHIYRK